MEEYFRFKYYQEIFAVVFVALVIIVLFIIYIIWSIVDKIKWNKKSKRR